MKKNKILVLSLTGVLALGTVSAYAASKADLINGKADSISSATTKTATKNNVKVSDVKLTEEDAKKIALEDSKNGEIKEVKLKKDDGNTVYKIVLTENGVEKEYKIDANSGKILKVEREDNEDNKEDEDNVDMSKADIKIKLDEAKKIALDRFPGSMIKEYSIEKEHGKLIYKIETITYNSKEELEIDANTGKILNIDSEKNDDVNLKDKAKISMEEAEKIAIQEVPGGTIKGSELKYKHSKLVYEIEINNKTTNKEFKIDANTGKIIDVEEE